MGGSPVRSFNTTAAGLNPRLDSPVFIFPWQIMNNKDEFLLTKLKQEFKAEGMGVTVRLEDKLNTQIRKLGRMRIKAVTPVLKAEYAELRAEALKTKQEMASSSSTCIVCYAGQLLGCVLPVMADTAGHCLTPNVLLRPTPQTIQREAVTGQMDKTGKVEAQYGRIGRIPRSLSQTHSGGRCAFWRECSAAMPQPEAGQRPLVAL